MRSGHGFTRFYTGRGLLDVDVLQRTAERSLNIEGLHARHLATDIFFVGKVVLDCFQLFTGIDGLPHSFRLFFIEFTSHEVEHFTCKIYGIVHDA